MNVDFSKNNLQKYLKVGFVCEKHPEEDLYIYGYFSNGNIIWDDINVHLRGLIVDSTGNIIARSFKKFFSFKAYLSPKTLLLSDNQIIQVPVGTPKIYEKMDGCLVMLYWLNGKPFLATQRSFTSDKAIRATKILYDKYAATFDRLQQDRTYIFEAIFSETRVIIDYRNVEELCLIGVLDNKTGEDLPLEDIGFRLPIEYTEDLSDVKDYRILQSLNIPNKEGFVLAYEDGFRMKIKFPWYQQVHTLFNKIMVLQEETQKEVRKLKAYLNMKENPLTNNRIFELLNSNQSVDTIFKNIPPSYYQAGVERWVQEIVEEYNKQKSNGGVNAAETISKEVAFDTNRIHESYKDSRMWNFINRIEETFE